MRHEAAFNQDRRRPPVGFNVTFTKDRAVFSRVDVAETAELASRLSIKQRMAALLRKGSWTAEQIADELDTKIDTVQKTVRRNKNMFGILPGGKIGLVARMAVND